MDAEKLAPALNDQLLRAWDIYIKFYTVFLGFNGVGLGFVVSAESGLSTAGIWLMSALFIAQNAITFVTALAMSAYTRRVAQSLTTMGAPGLAGFSPLGIWGGRGNALGHVALAGIWLVVAIARP